MCGSEQGQFRGNSESVGWKGSSGTIKMHPARSIRRAEWFEGSLRLLCEQDGATEVFALDGFKDSDFEPLWKYIEQACGVYLKKHRPQAAVEEADFDSAMGGIEDAADRVDEASKGSVQKKAKEADLMKKVEVLRDGLDQAVSGDKQALSRVFAANGCERIGRLRLVVDTVQLEIYHTDPRWKHLLSKCATIEAVLKELGTFRLWRPVEGHSSSLLKRAAIVRELRHRHGEEEVNTTDPTHPTPVPPPELPRKMPEVPILPKVSQLDADLPSQDQASASVQPHPEPEPVSHDIVKEDVPPKANEAKEACRSSRTPSESADEEAERSERVRRMLYLYPTSVMEGWVWKRSRFLKMWRRRWMVLLPGQLVTLKTRGQHAPTEVIPAGSVYRVYNAEAEVQQARCFCVGIRERNYYMVCDNESQQRSWIEAIEQTLCKKNRA